MSNNSLPRNPTRSTRLDPIRLAHIIGDAAVATAELATTCEHAAAEAYTFALESTYNSYHAALRILNLDPDLRIPHNTGVSPNAFWHDWREWFVYHDQLVAEPHADTDIWTCTCAYHRNGGDPRLCKHILAVWIHQQLEREEAR